MSIYEDEDFRKARRNLLYICSIIWICFFFIAEVENAATSPFGIQFRLDEEMRCWIPCILIPIFLYYLYKFSTFRTKMKSANHSMYIGTATDYWISEWLFIMDSITPPPQNENNYYGPLKRNTLFDRVESSLIVPKNVEYCYKESMRIAKDKIKSMNSLSYASIGQYNRLQTNLTEYLPIDLIDPYTGIDLWVLKKMAQKKNFIKKFKRKYFLRIQWDIFRNGHSHVDINIPWYLGIITIYAIWGILYASYLCSITTQCIGL